MRIITFLNYESRKEFQEHTLKPSETQPNQSYTLRELLENFTVDSRPNVERPVEFLGATDDPNLMFDPSATELHEIGQKAKILSDLEQQMRKSMEDAKRIETKDNIKQENQENEN